MDVNIYQTPKAALQAAGRYKGGDEMKAKKKKMTVAQQEAQDEREGQQTLWAEVHREHRGGYRENAGRKKGKKPPMPVHSVRCSAVEWKKVKKLLAEMRKENKKEMEL